MVNSRKTKIKKNCYFLKGPKNSQEFINTCKKGLAPCQYNYIPWSEGSPETLGVWQIKGDSSLNLAASSSVLGSSTGHCSAENPEAEAFGFATGCFSLTETSFGISEASSVRTSLYYKLLPKYMYICLCVL